MKDKATKRPSQFARVMAYFRTVDTDEANAALTTAAEIVATRCHPAPEPRKPRTRREARVKVNGSVERHSTLTGETTHELRSE